MSSWGMPLFWLCDHLDHQISAVMSPGYEEFIGAKKHLVLGSIPYIGEPQGSFATG
jgi:hypothetical protein